MQSVYYYCIQTNIHFFHKQIAATLSGVTVLILYTLVKSLFQIWVFKVCAKVMFIVVMSIIIFIKAIDKEDHVMHIVVYSLFAKWILINRNESH